jgi:hypothetical protein
MNAKIILLVSLVSLVSVAYSKEESKPLALLNIIKANSEYLRHSIILPCIPYYPLIREHYCQQLQS